MIRWASPRRLETSSLELPWLRTIRHCTQVTVDRRSPLPPESLSNVLCHTVRGGGRNKQFVVAAETVRKCFQSVLNPRRWSPTRSPVLSIQSSRNIASISRRRPSECLRSPLLPNAVMQLEYGNSSPRDLRCPMRFRDASRQALRISGSPAGGLFTLVSSCYRV